MKTARFIAGFALFLLAATTLASALAQATPAGYVFSRYAGIVRSPGVDDGTGTLARFNNTGNLAVDAAGNAFVIDATEHVIRRVTPAGVVTTWAGTPGVSGELNGPRTAALFQNLRGIAVNAQGVIFVADGHVIRKIDATGVVTTLAGVERMRGLADGLGPAARFAFPTMLAADANGAVYAVEPVQNTLRRIDANGQVTTVAGTGTSVTFPNMLLWGVEVAPDGNLFLLNGQTLLRMTPAGVVLGQVTVTLSDVRDMAVDSAGRVYIANQVSNVIVRVDGSSVTYPAPGLEFIGGTGVAPDGTLLLASASRRSIYRAQSDGTGATLLAGNYGSNGAVDGADGVARFGVISGLGVASSGVYVAERSGGGTSASGHTIKRVDANGTVTTIAGTVGASGFVDGLGGVARFSDPQDIASLPGGDLVVADTGNNAIRRMTAAGQVTTLAGGTIGFLDGVGTAARFTEPVAVAADSLGRVFVSDHGSRRIRRIATDGTVATLAGTGAFGHADGPGASATFGNSLSGIAVASDGTVFVADSPVIRAIATDGTVSTLAGLSSASGFADGTGAAARFSTLFGLVLDADGSLIVSDLGNCRLRRVTRAGVVTTIAGQTCVDSDQRLFGHSGAVRFTSQLFLEIMADGSLIVAESDFLRRAVPETLAAAAFITQPASVTALTGQSAQFAASTSSGATYQWELSSDNGATWGTLANGSLYSGTQTATLTVSATTTGMSGLAYRVVATTTGGSAASRLATLTLQGVTARPGALRFTALTTGTNGPLATATAPQSVTIQAAAGNSWAASVDQPWLSLSRTSASGSAALIVSIVDPGFTLSQSPGVDRTAIITVVPSGGGVSLKVPVILQVFATGSTAAPFGFLDTPSGTSTVRGSIAVTGWALDDVGIAHVKVFRDCLAAELQVNCQTLEGRSLVYIGDGVRVPGARFEDGRAYPEERSGGWGYLLLTNMLPRVTPFQPYGGAGRHQLTVIATDIEGNSTLIGSATIDLDNDTIAKPFGALDTPGQGQSVSGSLAIFGWAITPDAGTGIEIPTNGSSMVVYVDGLPIGLVTYNQCRGTVGNPVPSGQYCNDDVSNIFGASSPQPANTTRTSNPSAFRNLDAGRGAIGSYVLGTTSMTNGLHSLAWSVTDSMGRVEGIGSRNFEVLNGTADMSMPGVASSRGQFFGDEVLVRTGFGGTGEWMPVARGGDGRATIEVSVPGRLQVWVGAKVTSAALMVEGTAHPLPAGMTLQGGLLTWAPGPAHYGDYYLALLKDTERVDVIVRVR